MPKNLAWTQQQMNSTYVTIMSQVVVYALAERAKTFSLFPLSPSILIGCYNRILFPTVLRRGKM
jgi:hypothetical protein